MVRFTSSRLTLRSYGGGGDSSLISLQQHQTRSTSRALSNGFISFTYLGDGVQRRKVNVGRQSREHAGKANHENHPPRLPLGEDMERRLWLAGRMIFLYRGLITGRHLYVQCPRCRPTLEYGAAVAVEICLQVQDRNIYVQNGRSIVICLWHPFGGRHIVYGSGSHRLWGSSFKKESQHPKCSRPGQ